MRKKDDKVGNKVKDKMKESEKKRPTQFPKKKSKITCFMCMREKQKAA